TGTDQFVRLGIAIGGRASRARSSVDPSSRRGLVADWRKARSSSRDRSRETACPEGRQLRDSIYARVLPVPCHHAATIDTPARRRGTEPEPHGCDGTTVPTVPDSRTVAWEVRFSAVLGRDRTHSNERQSPDSIYAP